MHCQLTPLLLLAALPPAHPRTQERLGLWNKLQAERLRAVAGESEARRNRIAELHAAAKAMKERRRLDVYALNALLRMNEERKLSLLMEDKGLRGSGDHSGGGGMRHNV